MKKHLAGLVAIALVASGCANLDMKAGKPIEKGSLSRIQKGRTTRQEIESMYGKPSTTTINSDGTETLVYGYQATKVTHSPMAYVPILNIFAKAKTETAGQALSVQVKENTVINYAYSESGDKGSY